MKLNKEELLIGFLVGLVTTMQLGVLSLFIACLAAYLWAMTGSGDSKLYRRFGVPAVIALSIYCVTKNPIPFLSVAPAYAVLSLGYGIPSDQPIDDGSVLGRFALNVAGGDKTLADIYCRGVIYSILMVSFIPCFLTR